MPASMASWTICDGFLERVGLADMKSADAENRDFVRMPPEFSPRHGFGLCCFGGSSTIRRAGKHRRSGGEQS